MPSRAAQLCFVRWCSGNSPCIFTFLTLLRLNCSSDYPAEELGRYHLALFARVPTTGQPNVVARVSSTIIPATTVALAVVAVNSTGEQYANNPVRAPPMYQSYRSTGTAEPKLLTGGGAPSGHFEDQQAA